MNNVLGWEQVALRDAGLPLRAMADLKAFFQQCRASCPMDRAIDTTAAAQGLVCRGDYGIDWQFGDVANDDGQATGESIYGQDLIPGHAKRVALDARANSPSVPYRKLTEPGRGLKRPSEQKSP
jgi:hypothetical protein